LYKARRLLNMGRRVGAHFGPGKKEWIYLERRAHQQGVNFSSGVVYRGRRRMTVRTDRLRGRRIAEREGVEGLSVGGLWE